MSETKPVSARATPRPWAAQEPDEDGIAIIGLRTNNGVPYDSPTNGIVALVVMWPTEVDANDTERAKANAAFIVDAVNSHEALKEQVAWWEEQGRQHVTRIHELESELASCRECRANLDCLSRGAVPVRDDDLVQTWQQAQAALIEFKLWCRTDISRKAFDALHALEAALQPKDTAK